MVKQERAARTRQALIRAAAEVFAEEGFAPASLTRISSLAGVSNGALHFHFETKLALAEAVQGEASARVMQVTATAESGGADGLRALVDATHCLLSLLADDMVVRAGLGLSGVPLTADEVDLRAYWQQWIEAVLERAHREGALAEGVSPEQAASAVMAATVGFAVLGCRDTEWLSERTVAGYWELMVPRLIQGTGEEISHSAGECRGAG
ncbi:ScbR family autoregulator-binding transcription factor [Streptomyces sp. NPDC051561]|uniref:ScbR family autoregulator-binding transcription factor n=1 Tax=Streptomyces sp. NPDC051561 TaxID=3365658 RepID=UPI003795A503